MSESAQIGEITGGPGVHQWTEGGVKCLHFDESFNHRFGLTFLL